MQFKLLAFTTYEVLRCHCDSRYEGRTSQRLQDRIKQHLPKFIRTGQFFYGRTQVSRSCKLTKNVVNA